jgi:hypothetical protein
VSAIVVRHAVQADAGAIAGIHVRGGRAAYRGLVPDALLEGLSIERREHGRRGLIGAARGPRSRWSGRSTATSPASARSPRRPGRPTRRRGRPRSRRSTSSPRRAARALVGRPRRRRLAASDAVGPSAQRPGRGVRPPFRLRAGRRVEGRRDARGRRGPAGARPGMSADPHTGHAMASGKPGRRRGASCPRQTRRTRAGSAWPREKRRRERTSRPRSVPRDGRADDKYAAIDPGRRRLRARDEAPGGIRVARATAGARGTPRPHTGHPMPHGKPGRRRGASRPRRTRRTRPDSAWPREKRRRERTSQPRSVPRDGHARRQVRGDRPRPSPASRAR